MTFHPDSLPDLSGKVFVVTGGTSGIGYYTVAYLAQHGAHVYMCARSTEKGMKAIAEIKETQPSANIDVLQMDLMDLSSVVAAAKRLLTMVTTLHGLINNAGIMATPFEITKDGHEAQWQTNYLAHFVFTEHLLPLMIQTAKALPPGSVRIVNLTSSGHLGAPKGGINFSDPAMEKDGTPFMRYGQSKLANILHTKTLNRSYGPGSPHASDGKGEVWAACVHPGLVSTSLADDADANWGVRLLLSLLRILRFYWPADKGSWNTLFCAASQDFEVKQSGEYLEIFHRFGEPSCLSGSAKDEELATKLNQWTKEEMGKEGWLL
ncbi:hypothetical protein B0I35DRAFT_400832 [Stachybotrys elegans]|uniref:NAD(P)-binding protein n=1 Tax=Stachybotrys elegans TaxID=80388 RepID=A0A8K0SFF2_9HYPO|nr:hypothetical protein B0I35DRAFT_400832 [Stachybotrys elegans]